MREIEPIYFEKFIQHYFNREVLNLTRKISKYLDHHHLFILHKHNNPVYRIVRYSIKINQLNIVPFSSGVNYPEKAVVVIQLANISEDLLENI